MAKCKWILEIERYFDGQSSQTEEVTQHLNVCPSCAAFHKQLETMRQGVQISVQHETIRDAQFNAFMDGIREGVAARASVTVPPRRRWWAWMSLTAAALIVSVATFVVLTNGQKPVDATATVVESCTTDLEGGSVTSYKSEGVTTVWVTVTKDDVW